MNIFSHIIAASISERRRVRMQKSHTTVLWLWMTLYGGAVGLVWFYSDPSIYQIDILDTHSQPMINIVNTFYIIWISVEKKCPLVNYNYYLMAKSFLIHSTLYCFIYQIEIKTHWYIKCWNKYLYLTSRPYYKT